VTRHPVDFLLSGAGELVTLEPAQGEGSLGVIRRGALAARQGRIVWAGAEADARRAVELTPNAVHVDARGRVVLPGFVDSHTHLVFAGSREHEFARRIAGASYQEIAAAGGGILATVGATRRSTADELVALARPRLDLALRHGTTTIEVMAGRAPSALLVLRHLSLSDHLGRRGRAAQSEGRPPGRGRAASAARWLVAR
jgi:imidazolonepropionase